MKKGDKKRRVGETNMNERSSRSHTIFRIVSIKTIDWYPASIKPWYSFILQTIESRPAGSGAEDGAVQVSQLNLVDLAGSERAAQTGATGDRFKEGRHINLSLSSLGLVIKQLSEGQDHVNFRDSKLTRILQTSLGGNAMTTIICAVTPAALEETQCTLAWVYQVFWKYSQKWFIQRYFSISFTDSHRELRALRTNLNSTKLCPTKYFSNDTPDR